MPPCNKRHTSKCNTHWKSKHNLTVPKLKCIWNKYITYGKLKMTKNSEKYNTKYKSGSYLLLFGTSMFGKKNWLNFEISCK